MRHGIPRVIGLLLLLGLGGCAEPEFHSVDLARCRAYAPDEMASFTTEAALERYVGCIAKILRTRAELSTEGMTPTSASSNDTITNNQEKNVDEGDIVKKAGDTLLVLRKGRLHAVSIAASGQPRQTDTIRVAPEESLNRDVWYDELLVAGETVYVIGYRYALLAADDNDSSLSAPTGTTEIGVFSLRDGKLERRATHFFESDDYYSGRDYAARLVAGRLVLYQPIHLLSRRGGLPKARLPHFLEYSRGRFHPRRLIVDARNVVWSNDVDDNPTLHAILTCDTTAVQLTCAARAVLGGYGSTRYVSSNNAFLTLGQSKLFTLPLDDEAVTAHHLPGEPLDAFSYRERDGRLDLVVSRDGRIRLATFALGRKHTAPDEVIELGETPSTVTANRFVGDKLVLALVAQHIGYYTGPQHNAAATLLVHDIPRKSTVRLPLSGAVERIEPLGDGAALVVASTSRYYGSEALRLEPLDLRTQPRFVGAIELLGVTQGERRSHGFFFRETSDGGWLGLPVVNRSTTTYGYGTGVSNIGFFRLHADRHLSAAGIISSTPQAAGECEVSCVDWYGNTRPIFTGDRIFALMGSELQEVTVESGSAAPLGTRLVLTRD